VLAALVRIRAKQHNVAVPLLASRSDIERLAGGEREESPLLTGWRRTLVGEELLEMLDGRLSLRIENGRVLVTPTDGEGG
jgi:ribonuclease D